MLEIDVWNDGRSVYAVCSPRRAKIFYQVSGLCICSNIFWVSSDNSPLWLNRRLWIWTWPWYRASNPFWLCIYQHMILLNSRRPDCLLRVSTGPGQFWGVICYSPFDFDISDCAIEFGRISVDSSTIAHRLDNNCICWGNFGWHRDWSKRNTASCLRFGSCDRMTIHALGVECGEETIVALLIKFLRAGWTCPRVRRRRDAGGMVMLSLRTMSSYRNRVKTLIHCRHTRQQEYNVLTFIRGLR